MGVIEKFAAAEVINSVLLFLNPKFHYCMHKRPPVNPTLSALRPVDTSELINLIDFHQCKGKAIPLQSWTGPEGSRRLRLPDFKTIGT